MAPKYVLGVDGGTGGIRAGLFEIATGAPVGFADTPYDTIHPEPGYAEQNPNDWWDGLGASVRRVLAETGVAPEDVTGMCCDTTCCTVVALDDAGDALMPCILWMDMRAAEQTEQVRRLSLATVVPETRLVAVARLESFTAPPRARPSHDPPHSPPDAFSSRARVSRRSWPRATPRCACAAAAPAPSPRSG